MIKRTETFTSHDIAPQQRLFEMIQGYSKTQVIYVFATLGVADRLKAGVCEVSELASLLKVDESAFRRFMLAAVDLGLCSKSKQDSYSLTTLGECLRSDTYGSLRELAMLNGAENYVAWGQLLYSIQTGENAFIKTFGKDLFEYATQDPELVVRFHRLLENQARASARAVLTAYDFSNVSRVVDVGGGYGTLLISLLKVQPRLTGILLDRASTITEAEKQLASAAVGNRCLLVSGDFFEQIPASGDLYILSQILHDWNDEKAVDILKNCAQAMTKHSKLLVIEQIIPEQITASASPVIWSDLIMLVLTGGQERTLSQYRMLLETAGFRLQKTLQTNSAITILEAVLSPAASEGEPSHRRTM